MRVRNYSRRSYHQISPQRIGYGERYHWQQNGFEQCRQQRISFEISTDQLSYKTDRFRIILLRSNPHRQFCNQCRQNVQINRECKHQLEKVENEERIARYIVERSRWHLFYRHPYTIRKQWFRFIQTYMGCRCWCLQVRIIIAHQVCGHRWCFTNSATSFMGNVQQPKELSVYPNPVTAKTIQLVQFITRNGNYVLRLINASRSFVEQRNIVLDAGNAVRSIRLHESDRQEIIKSSSLQLGNWIYTTGHHTINHLPGVDIHKKFKYNFIEQPPGAAGKHRDLNRGIYISFAPGIDWYIF